MRTSFPKEKDIEHRWWVLDASGAILGRLAAEAARLIRGKHKPIFTPHLDCGDNVIVVNADKVRLSGRKESGKTYWRYSGYPGGLRMRPAAEVRRARPEDLLRHAVRGMLPHTPLGRRLAGHLHVYAGPDHPHAAQKPSRRELKG